MKILIVEDNEDSRNLLMKQLRAYGHEVTPTANGVEALQQALAQSPDIIVSDILMPKMDGYQLCQECKQNEQLKNIPFVFYTATYTLDEDKKFALSLGADIFIVKPAEPDAFVQMLCEVFEKAKSGALAPPEVAPLKPSLFLDEYSKRIITKLDKKVAQLEAEITERKRAEEEVEHLNRVLRTIRGINQLIVKEKEQDKLFKNACATLIKNRSYDSACICRFDESRMLVTHAEAGLDKDFLPVVERLKRGELTDCIKRTLIQSGVVITKVSSLTCGDCPLVEKCSGKKVVTIRIEHGGKVYGLLKLQLSRDASISGEEQSLLQEVTSDVAFALHDMELEEERNRLENSLKERIKELQCLYGIADIAGRSGITLDELYQEVVNLLPSAWQYPEITCARITFGDKKFRTDNFKTTEWVQSADIDIKRQKEGTVEVYYLEARPEIDEGPFLKEERLLIEAITERLGSVTERMQAEEDIRKFKTISDRAGYGASIASLEGKFIYINKSYAEMHGYSPSELIGEYFSILYPEDQLEILNKSRNRLLKTGVYFAQELWHKRRDGTVFPTVTTAGLIRDDEGRPLYIYSMVIDITERKKAEEALVESEEKFKKVFRLGPEAMAVTRISDGKLIDVSDSFERMFGYHREEILGHTATEIGLWSRLEQRDQMVQILQKNGSVRNLDVELRTKSGEKRDALFSAEIIDIKGEKCMIAVAIDITERKKMQAQLMMSDRLATIGELVSGVAHELNNPMTGIIGFSELLLDQDVSDDVREDLETINKEAKRTAEIVKGLLTFARKQKTEKESVDISKVIQAVLNLRAYEQKINNIEVNTHFPADLPKIIANGSQLQQVFLNLIVNAEQAMFEAHNKGILTVTSEQVGDIVRISLTDDGPGITQENLKHLFDPFFTTKGEGKGTGLGLSISHGIITEHGGMIYADSELGKGATFVIELPMYSKT